MDQTKQLESVLADLIKQLGQAAHQYGPTALVQHVMQATGNH
jgi:hypothetical protein